MPMRIPPLSAHISISIMGNDGFTKAVIGPVKDDLDGRTPCTHPAQLLSQKGPFLDLLWRRLQGKHGADLDAHGLAPSELFGLGLTNFVFHSIVPYRNLSH